MSETTTITDRHRECADELCAAIATDLTDQMKGEEPKSFVPEIIAKHFPQTEPVAWLFEYGDSRFTSLHRDAVINAEERGFTVTALYK